MMPVTGPKPAAWPALTHAAAGGSAYRESVPEGPLKGKSVGETYRRCADRAEHVDMAVAGVLTTSLRNKST